VKKKLLGTHGHLPQNAGHSRWWAYSRKSGVCFIKRLALKNARYVFSYLKVKK